MNTAMSENHPGHQLKPSASEKSDFTFESSLQKQSPRLSHRALTLLLLGMCLIPVATITALWQYLPPVHEGELEANVYAVGLPSADFYQVEYYKRPPVEGGVLVLENRSDQDWTHLNIQVNGNYQVYDKDPIPAHGERRYELKRFVSRSGARFSLQYNELSRVRVYARRPTKDRATYFHEFPTYSN
jgi:hypothetical protein